MILVFGEKLPAGLIPQVRELVMKYIWLVPSWVQEMHIGYDEGHNGESATECDSKRYRWASIKLKPRYFHEDYIFEREITIIHEMLHISTHAHYDLANGLITDLTEANSQTMKDFVANRLEEFYEAGTQDLAFAIYNFVNRSTEARTIKEIRMSIEASEPA